MGLLGLVREPTWRRQPLACACRVASSLARRRIPLLREPAVTFDDGRSSVIADLGTSLGLRLFRYGMRDPEFDLTRLLLHPGEVFVDVGANVGLFSLVAAARVGSTGRVLACEPAPRMRAMVERNARLNHFRCIETHGVAVADYTGSAEFVVFEGDGSGMSSFQPANLAGGQVEVVEVTTLDDLISEEERSRVALLKIDVEGAEGSVLRGGRRLIDHVRPDVLIEVEADHLARQGTSVGELQEFTDRAGYEAFRVAWDECGSVVLHHEDDWCRHARTPNLFLTTDTARAIAAGVTCR